MTIQERPRGDVFHLYFCWECVNSYPSVTDAKSRALEENMHRWNTAAVKSSWWVSLYSGQQGASFPHPPYLILARTAANQPNIRMTLDCERRCISQTRGLWASSEIILKSNSCGPSMWELVGCFLSWSFYDRGAKLEVWGPNLAHYFILCCSR